MLTRIILWFRTINWIYWLHLIGMTNLTDDEVRVCCIAQDVKYTGRELSREEMRLAFDVYRSWNRNHPDNPI